MPQHEAGENTAVRQQTDTRPSTALYWLPGFSPAATGLPIYNELMKKMARSSLCFRMVSDLHRGDELVAGSPGPASLSWTPAFDQHVPARVVSAVSFTDGFVVLSGESGVDPAIAAAVVGRMREAGFEVATVTAPLSDRSMLYAAIRDALLAKSVPERPLVVIVEHAEGLSAEAVRRLVALDEVRHADRPVLRVLLTGTPALWPILRDAGLGDLEHDAAAHVRLMPDLIRNLPEPAQAADGYLHEPGTFGFDGAIPDQMPRGQGFPPRMAVGAVARLELPSLRLGTRRSGGRAAVMMAGLTLAGIGLAGGAALWTVRPDRQATAVPVMPPAAAPLPSPDERLAHLLDRQDQEFAAGHPLPGGDLDETQRQIDELLPQVSGNALHALATRLRPAATGLADVAIPRLASPTAAPQGGITKADPPPSVPAAIPSSPDASASGGMPQVGGPVESPAPGPMHVTLQYSRGDRAAAARAMQIRMLLHDRGIPVDGPLAVGQVIERSSLAYYFTQDQAAALDLAQHLSPRAPQVRKLPPPGGLSLPRPGEISISIGSGESAETRPPGNNT